MATELKSEGVSTSDNLNVLTAIAIENYFYEDNVAGLFKKIASLSARDQIRKLSLVLLRAVKSKAFNEKQQQAKLLVARAIEEFTVVFQKNYPDQEMSSLFFVELSTLLFHSGKLLMGGVPDKLVEVAVVNIEQLHYLLRVLQKSKNFNDMSLALWGAGRLAARGCIKSSLNVEVIQSSLSQLESSSSNTDISFALLGAGWLAKYGALENPLQVAIVRGLVRRSIKNDNSTAKSIAGIVRAAGDLADNGALDGGLKLSAHIINNWLRKIKQLNHFQGDIVDVLLGVSYLVKNKHVDGQIDVMRVNGGLKWLKNRFIKREISSQPLEVTSYAHNIADMLLAMAYFADNSSALDGPLHKDIFLAVNFLLDKLDVLLRCAVDPDVKYIANTLLAIGHLTGAHHIKITAVRMNAFLAKFNDWIDYAEERDIINVLIAVSLVATSGLSRGKLKAEHLNGLLARLRGFTGLGALVIANKLFGIGYLASKGCLRGEVSAEVISGLLKNLAATDAGPQDIAVGLLGAGYLAVNHNLNGRLDVGVIKDCLERLNDLVDDSVASSSENIAKALLGAAYVWFQQEYTPNEAEREIVDSLLGKFFILVEKNLATKEEIQEVMQFYAMTGQGAPQLLVAKFKEEYKKTSTAMQLALQDKFPGCKLGQIMGAWPVAAYIPGTGLPGRPKGCIIDFDTSQKVRNQVWVKAGFAVLQVQNYQEPEEERDRDVFLSKVGKELEGLLASPAAIAEIDFSARSAELEAISFGGSRSKRPRDDDEEKGYPAPKQGRVQQGSGLFQARSSYVAERSASHGKDERVSFSRSRSSS